MAAPLLALQDIAISFGGTPLLTGAELSVGEGERLCVVGRNGSGKSTLLKIAAGTVEADRGTRVVQQGVSIRYLPQEPDLSAWPSVFAFVEDGLGPTDDADRARALLGKLGLTGDEAPATLSGGEARRAALVRALAPEPDILLLDEPTNHLDLPAIEWLEEQLRSLRSAIVLISHDRRFLERLSRATVWVDRGLTRRMERGFDRFEAWRDEVYEEEERNRHKLDRKIVMEEDWLRYGVTARRKRNVRRLGNLVALREARRTAQKATGTVKLAAASAETSGKLVIEAVGLTKSWGGPPVVKEFSLRVARGDRVGIVGPNGSGKTTLLNLLTGTLAADAGTLRLGANLQMVGLDQHRESLDPETTLSDALTGGRGDTVRVGQSSRHVMSYMKDFLFQPEQARSPLRVLSGGERGRLMLARALAKPSNLLVLDEPTNDLDLETLDLLEELLADYAGTLLLVSHDRDFLDRVATSVIMSDGEGRWIEYAGGYSDMVAQRGAGVGAKSAAPKVSRAEERSAERAPASVPAPRRKLSFKEKHALETLPGVIAGLESELADLRRTLADPGLYNRDAARFSAAAERVKSAEAELAVAEEWLTLELLREELGG